MAQKESDCSYFLVQSTGYPAHHWTRKFEDRTYAEELQKHQYYRHDAWQTGKKDQDFSRVQPGDILLQYCTMNVADGPGRIRDIWEVTTVEPVPKEDLEDALNRGNIEKDQAKELSEPRHVLRLRFLERLDGGVSRSTIHKAVDEGKLSKAMANCGRMGFNICRVEEADYRALLELDRFKPGAEVSLLEDKIETYLAEHGDAEAIDTGLSGYKLFRDAEGKTGDQYETYVVGRIDLLYVDGDGNFLVVELKRTDDTDDKAVGQIARYMSWVRHHLANGREVRGAIVTHSSSTQLRYAVEELRNASLYEFEVKFDFNKVKLV